MSAGTLIFTIVMLLFGGVKHIDTPENMAAYLQVQLESQLISLHCYSPEDIAEICGCEYGEREYEYNGVKYIHLYRNGKRENNTDYLYFDVFESPEAAKKSFRARAKNYHSLEDEGDNYREGWLKDVCDAEVCQFEYLSGNVIVYTEVAVYSCWEGEGGWDDPAFKKEIKAFIREHF